MRSWNRYWVLFVAALSGLIGGLTLGNCASGQQQAAQSAGGPAPGVVRQSGLECIGRLRPRPSEQIDGSPWGVSCHWIADNHGLSIEKQLDGLAWLGAKWAVLCPDWDRIETEKGKYAWNSPALRFDDVMAGLARRKIAPVIQIYGSNRLYIPFSPDWNQRPLADAAKLLDDAEVRQAWHRYIEALVRRYQGQVKAWEIWNEPNGNEGTDFWLTKTSVEQYGRIVKEAAAVIRKVDPHAVILAGSTAMVPIDYAEAFLKSEGKDSFDHWSVHPYGAVPEEQDANMVQVAELLRKAGRSGVLWQSECGFPSDANTGGWGYGGPWDETKHAKWVLRRLLCDVAVGSQVSVCYVLTDYPAMLEGGPNKGKMGINRKGLFTADSCRPKLAAYAYRQLASLIDQRFEAEPLPTTIELVASGSFGKVKPESIRTYTLRHKETGSLLIVYWLPVPMETKAAPGKIKLSVTSAGLQDAVLVDLLDGRVYRPTRTLNADGKVTFGDLPLADSPLILCDRTLVEPLADRAIPK